MTDQMKTEVAKYAEAYINGLISWGEWPASIYIAIETEIHARGY